MPSRSRGRPVDPKAGLVKKGRTTTERGLGHAHQVQRDRLLTRHVDGRKCWWCGKPMYRDPTRNWDGFALEADHPRSRSVHGTIRNVANRLLHKKCNIARGDGSHDHERPALAIIGDIVDTSHAEDPAEDLGVLAIAWPWRTA